MKIIELLCHDLHRIIYPDHLISYLIPNSFNGSPQNIKVRAILLQLQHLFECFSCSLARTLVTLIHHSAKRLAKLDLDVIQVIKR